MLNIYVTHKKKKKNPWFFTFSHKRIHDLFLKMSEKKRKQSVQNWLLKTSISRIMSISNFFFKTSDFTENGHCCSNKHHFKNAWKWQRNPRETTESHWYFRLRNEGLSSRFFWNLLFFVFSLFTFQNLNLKILWISAN